MFNAFKRYLVIQLSIAFSHLTKWAILLGMRLFTCEPINLVWTILLYTRGLEKGWRGGVSWTRITTIPHIPHYYPFHILYRLVIQLTTYYTTTCHIPLLVCHILHKKNCVKKSHLSRVSYTTYYTLLHDSLTKKCVTSCAIS